MEDIYKRTKADEDKPVIKVIGKKRTYEQMLEFAYASHIDPRMADAIHKKEAGVDFYKILMFLGNNKNDKEDAFCINYIYSSKADVLVASKIELLPKGWQAEFMAGVKDRVLISDNEGDGFIFTLSNPFLSWVVVDK